MTNAMIILMEQIRLMDEGLLGNTGREFEYIDPAGEKHTLMEPIPIHTFLAWKQMGYSVKKGEHAITKIPVWKYLNARGSVPEQEEGEDHGRMYMKTAAFFSAEQVEKIVG